MRSIEPHLWQKMMEHVIAHGGDIIKPWFAQLTPRGLDGGQLEIEVPGDVEQKTYCQQHATRLFTEAIQEATGRLISVRFLSPQTDKATNAHPGSHIATDQPALNDEYTFDTFVTGPCNRLASAACLAVVERPGSTYNPLFIHGAAGLGKTHLLQATCRALLEKHPDTKISYLSCETFINHLIEAIGSGRVHEFRYRYRSADVLVIDDIQFLSNHDQTQEEFFHTFNTLYQSHKQIILSCDRSPSEIPHLEERLLSRFSWGLVARIDRPAYETRVAIIRKKASLRGTTLPDDVICFIAGTIVSNTRELEGAITKISMLSQVLNHPIDLSLAENALTSKTTATPNISVERIINVVAKHYNIRLADIQSRKRTKSVSLPRQICMYLARRLTRHSLEEIGGYFGGRDHSTVLHAFRTVEQLQQNDPIFHATIEQIIHEIKGA